MSKPREVYLILGGSGFLGRVIVDQLLARGDIVNIFDIVQRYQDVPFYSGDMTDQTTVEDALRKSGTTCIIHTASPSATTGKSEDFYRINVEGTRSVIAAAVAVGVRKLVYTSSASVVYDGSDLANGDERLPYPKKPLETYSDSKAKAEALVLEANGKGGLLTVALRPAGIFGPKDPQMIAGLAKAFHTGKTHFQIGDNNNLFDCTWVGNVAKAHLLAADKLSLPPPAPPLDKPPTTLDDIPSLTDAERDLLMTAVPSVDASIGKHRIPTCEARPLGPYVTRPPNADKIEAAFHDPHYVSKRPAIPNQFNAFSEYGIRHAKFENPSVHPLQIAGQAFTITNGEPTYFWDFARAVWAELDKYFPGKRKPRRTIVLPRNVGLVLASGAEWFTWMTGIDLQFTWLKIVLASSVRYYDIEKARRVLGYEPDVGIHEGIQKAVAAYYEDYQAGKFR